MLKPSGITLLASWLLLWPTASAANPIFMDFEGLTDPGQVGSFYDDPNGGGAHGVIWSSEVPNNVHITSDVFGESWGNEPSPDTVVDPNRAVISVAAGFGSVSFHYAALGDASTVAGRIDIYDAVGGINGPGSVLDTVTLYGTGDLFSWQFVSFAVPAAARSVGFQTSIQRMIIDDMSLGTPIPEPASLLLVGLGVVAVAVRRRR